MKGAIGKFVMNEKTKVSFRMATAVSILAFIITATAAAISWKGKIETDITRNEAEIERSYTDVRERVKGHTEKLNILEPVIIKMQTDIEWIRNSLERGQ